MKNTNLLIVGLVVLVLVVVASLNMLPFGIRFNSEGFQTVPPSPTQKVGVNPAVKPAPVMPKPAPAVAPVVAPVAPAVPTPVGTTMPVPPNPAMNAPSAPAPATPSAPMAPATQMAANSPAPNAQVVASSNIQQFQNMNNQQGMNYNMKKEGFLSYESIDQAGGAKDKYEPMGAFDGVTLPTGNNVSTWRYTAPNEELLGAPFEVGDDSLFIFKNNQCKPECCGASFSCSGGCVCSTKEQRNYIAGRGGNVSLPDDNV